jgi:hypothetical protein
MNGNPLGKYTVSFGLSLALCSVLNALVVVANEKSPAVAAAMQRLTGHHWITHSAGIVVLFVLFGWLFSLLNGGRGPQLAPGRLLGFVAGGILAGGVLIIGFYLVAD